MNRRAHLIIRSIDTMKYSRDLARLTLTDTSLQKDIEIQVKAIAETEANYIALGTPYDEEFLPVLKLWVKEARKNNLKVFFRGNFSGWEEWFGYPKIDRQTHIKKIKGFIENNEDLFEEGDILSSCPECENGEKLDRSSKEQIGAYRAFLIKEYQTTKSSFRKIGKKVDSNYFSMNGDMALLVMDRKTTALLDGIVVIDHYVLSSEKLIKDIRFIAKKSRGKVVLGEFGAPIPGVHGNMSEEEQAEWIDQALTLLSKEPDLIGINYWVNIGGSTAIWKDSTHPKKSVEKITRFFLGQR